MFTSGYVIDVRMSPDWTEACPFSDGQATVPTLIGTAPFSDFVFWGTLIDSSQRYYFLELGEGATDGNIVIAVEVCCGVGRGYGDSNTCDRILCICPRMKHALHITPIG